MVLTRVKVLRRQLFLLHLLVQNHPDQQGQGALGEELVGGGVLGQMQLGHEFTLTPGAQPPERSL